VALVYLKGSTGGNTEVIDPAVGLNSADLGAHVALSIFLFLPASRIALRFAFYDVQLRPISQPQWQGFQNGK